MKGPDVCLGLLVRNERLGSGKAAQKRTSGRVFIENHTIYHIPGLATLQNNILKVREIRLAINFCNKYLSLFGWFTVIADIGKRA